VTRGICKKKGTSPTYWSERGRKAKGGKDEAQKKKQKETAVTFKGQGKKYLEKNLPHP